MNNAIVTCRATSGGKNASGVRGFGRANCVILFMANFVIVVGGPRASRLDWRCLPIIYTCTIDIKISLKVWTIALVNYDDEIYVSSQLAMRVDEKHTLAFFNHN